MMDLKKFSNLKYLILLPLLASACGQLDTVITPSGSYRVSASVNGAALEECSIVNSYSSIQPYFLDSIMEDPDIVGLRVSIHAMNGELAGGKIHYSWAGDYQGPDALEVPVTSAEIPGETSQETSQTTLPPAESYDALPAAGDSLQGDEDESPKGQDPLGLFSRDPEDDENYDPGEAPGEDFPSGISEIDPSQTNPVTETSALSENPLGVSKSVSISGGGTANFYQEEIIHISSIDRYLPPFFFPDYLQPGQYLIIFQVQGVQGVVNSLEKPVMYIGDAEFELQKIQTYYSEDLGDSHIVSPGASVMLESQITYNPKLDPYLVWYSGNRRISEGYFRAGSNRILWNAPAESGFQTLRAEAFPFMPESSSNRRIQGRIIDLSIPVSKKNAKTNAIRTVDPSWGDATLDYAFSGVLTDSLDPGNSGNSLKPLGNARTTWKPRGKLYGLHIDGTKSYALPENPFALSRNVSEGKGALLFRFAPLKREDDGIAQNSEWGNETGAGALFKASFDLETLLSKLVLEVSCADNELVLEYGMGSEIQRVSRTLPPIPEALLGASLYFFFDRNNFIASFAFDGETPSWDPAKIVYLPEPLTGKGTFTLGGFSGTGSGTAAIASPKNPGLILDEALIQFAAGELDWETLLEKADAEPPSPETETN